MHQIVCRLELHPSAPPDLLAGLRGPTSKGRRGEGRGRERKEGECAPPMFISAPPPNYLLLATRLSGYRQIGIYTWTVIVNAGRSMMYVMYRIHSFFL